MSHGMTSIFVKPTWEAVFPVFSRYDATIFHPPLHSGSIGLLNCFGFAWYYAEATPVVLWFLLAIWVEVRGAFPASVKLGLLFGMAFLMSVGPRSGFVYFGTRPEGHVEAAWLAGLPLLEDGRLKEWNSSRLFAGAVALTWASSVHYYAGAAVAEDENFSADTQASQRTTISSAYADGALQPRGFYFSATDPDLEFVLLSAHPVSAVQGYAMLGGRLQRFDQDPDGDYELIAAACPSLPETPYERWNSRWPDTASAVLYLPGPRPDGATNVVTHPGA